MAHVASVSRATGRKGGGAAGVSGDDDSHE